MCPSTRSRGSVGTPARGLAASPGGLPAPCSLRLTRQMCRPRHKRIHVTQTNLAFFFFWFCFFDEKRASSNENGFSELRTNQGEKLEINFLKSSVYCCSVPRLMGFAATQLGSLMTMVRERAGRKERCASWPQTDPARGPSAHMVPKDAVTTESQPFLVSEHKGGFLLGRSVQTGLGRALWAALSCP